MRPHVLHFIGHGEGGPDPRKHALLIHHPAWKDPDDPAAEVVDAFDEQWFLHDIRNDLQGLPLRVEVQCFEWAKGIGAQSLPGSEAPASP